jgi:hypothetical protein
MANSTRNRTQRQAEIAKVKDGPIGEARSAPETPNLWHAAPRSECWTGASGAGAESWGSPFASPGRPALRLRRLPRRRTPLHCSRPSPGAAARFTSCGGEFLTD